MGQSSANLGLYLPDKNDYVVVSRDLSDNFQKIDDAVIEYTKTVTTSSAGNVGTASLGIPPGYTIVRCMLMDNGTPYVCTPCLTSNSLIVHIAKASDYSALANASVKLKVLCIKEPTLQAY